MIASSIQAKISTDPRQDGQHIKWEVSVKTGFGKDAPEHLVTMTKYGQLASNKIMQYVKAGKVMMFTGEMVLAPHPSGGVLLSHMEVDRIKFVPFEDKKDQGSGGAARPAQTTSGPVTQNSEPVVASAGSDGDIPF